MDSTLLILLIAFQANLRYGGCCFNNYNPYCSYNPSSPITIPVRYTALPLKGVRVIPISNGGNGEAPSCQINFCPQNCCGGLNGSPGGEIPGGSVGPGANGLPNCPGAYDPSNCPGRYCLPSGPGGYGPPSSPGGYGPPSGQGGCGPPSCPDGSPSGPGGCGPSCGSGAYSLPNDCGKYAPPCCPGGIDKCAYPSCICCPRPDEPDCSECQGGPGSSGSYSGEPKGQGGPGDAGGSGGFEPSGGPGGPGGPEISCGSGCPGIPSCRIIPCCLSSPKGCEYPDCPSNKGYCPEGPGGILPVCQNFPGASKCPGDSNGICYPLLCKTCSPPTSPQYPAPNPQTPDWQIPSCYMIPSQNQDKLCKCPFTIQKDCTCDGSSDDYSGLVYGNGNAPSSNMPGYSCSDVVPRPTPSPSPPYDCKAISHCSCNCPNNEVRGIQENGSDGYPCDRPGDTPGEMMSCPSTNVPLCAKHYLIRSLRPVYDECIRKIPIIQKVVHHEPVTTVRTVPYIKRHVVSKRERYVCQVPVVEKLKICDYQYQTKMVPCKKTRVVPTVQMVVVRVPVTEKINKPLYKEIVKHVPRVCYRMKPVVQENIIQIPVKERRYRPVVVQRVIKVPVKSCIRKNFIEQKVHKSYCPCECC